MPQLVTTSPSLSSSAEMTVRVSFTDQPPFHPGPAPTRLGIHNRSTKIVPAGDDKCPRISASVQLLSSRAPPRAVATASLGLPLNMWHSSKEVATLESFRPPLPDDDAVKMLPKKNSLAPGKPALLCASSKWRLRTAPIATFIAWALVRRS